MRKSSRIASTDDSMAVRGAPRTALPVFECSVAAARGVCNSVSPLGPKPLEQPSRNLPSDGCSEGRLRPCLLASPRDVDDRAGPGAHPPRARRLSRRTRADARDLARLVGPGSPGSTDRDPDGRRRGARPHGAATVARRRGRLFAGRRASHRGRTRIIAFIQETAAARQILQHLGLPHRPPPIAPARPPPQQALGFPWKLAGRKPRTDGPPGSA